jgi:hypothetical protein
VLAPVPAVEMNHVRNGQQKPVLCTIEVLPDLLLEQAPLTLGVLPRQQLIKDTVGVAVVLEQHRYRLKVLLARLLILPLKVNLLLQEKVQETVLDQEQLGLMEERSLQQSEQSDQDGQVVDLETIDQSQQINEQALLPLVEDKLWPVSHYCAVAFTIVLPLVARAALY